MRPGVFKSKTPPPSSIFLSHSCLSQFLTDTQIISRLWIVALALVSCQLCIYVSVRMTGRAVMNIVRLRDGAPLSDSIILSIRVTDLKVAATVSPKSRGLSCVKSEGVRIRCPVGPSVRWRHPFSSHTNRAQRTLWHSYSEVITGVTVKIIWSVWQSDNSGTEKSSRHLTDAFCFRSPSRIKKKSQFCRVLDILFIQFMPK